MDSPLETRFFEALTRHIGIERLVRLQEKAKVCGKGTGEKSIKPVAPDLWLIGKNGDFHFIESKMPWDTIRPGQVAGLKLIKKHLKINFPVRVGIINLQPV